jgi:hypothetical protein
VIFGTATDGSSRVLFVNMVVVDANEIVVYLVNGPRVELGSSGGDVVLVQTPKEGSNATTLK